MRTHRLRWQLAAGQALLALALLIGGTFVLANRTDNLRRTEATVGADHDAEVLAEQLAPKLAEHRKIDEELTSSDTRKVELTDVDGHHLSGDVLSSDPRIVAAVARSIDNLDPTAGSDGIEVSGWAVGIQPVVHADELLGVVVVAEPAPSRRGWRQLYGLDPIAAAVLALLAAAMGWWLAGRITRPLARLTDGARSVLLSGTTDPLPPSRITEIAVLGAAFEHLAGGIRREASSRHELEVDLRRLSHELRTPLTTIRLQLDALSDTDDEAESPPTSAVTSRTDETLGVINGQLDRLDRLSEQLSQLRHARPEATSVDLGHIAAAAVDRLRPLAEWGRIDLQLVTHGDTPVRAERDSLEDAISNLVENAIKHSPRASRVTVTTQGRDGWCTLEVIDAGPGLAAGLRDVILRPGVRVVGSTIARGTGQGLAIVASTLDRLGGRLEIADAPGGGALIRMVLPHDADGLRSGVSLAAVEPSLSVRVLDPPGR